MGGADVTISVITLVVLAGDGIYMALPLACSLPHSYRFRNTAFGPLRARLPQSLLARPSLGTAATSDRSQYSVLGPKDRYSKSIPSRHEASVVVRLVL